MRFVMPRPAVVPLFVAAFSTPIAFGSWPARVAAQAAAASNAGRAVDHDTIFHRASITKTFTAIAIMPVQSFSVRALDGSRSAAPVAPLENAWT
jgi:hypothetical protein